MADWFPSLITTLVGVFVGSAVTGRVHSKRRAISEIQSVNAALLLCFTICNRSLNFKKQIVRPVADNYQDAEGSVRAQEIEAARHPGPGPFEIVLSVNLLTFEPLKLPTDALEKHLFEKTTVAGRPLAAAVELFGAIDSLEKAIAGRTSLTQEIHRGRPWAGNDLANLIFGWRTPDGGRDERFRTSLEAIVLYTDDCIFFSRLIADDLHVYGTRLRRRRMRSFQFRLTREEAATLIRKAWRYRERQNYRETNRHTRRHAARFMVVARYMGSRAGVICGASIEPQRPKGKPWVDLKNGVFYGRPTGEKETKKRRQRVRVPLPLLAHMRRWRANGQRYVVEWNGQPVTSIRKAHEAAVVDAGLGCYATRGRSKVFVSDVTPHTWRHTVATWLMQAGAEPWAAAGFLAMSVETLLRNYGHHHPDHSAEAHKAIHRQRNAKDTSERKANIDHDNVAEIAVKSLIA